MTYYHFYTVQKHNATKPSTFGSVRHIVGHLSIILVLLLVCLVALILPVLIDLPHKCPVFLGDCLPISHVFNPHVRRTETELGTERTQMGDRQSDGLFGSNLATLFDLREPLSTRLGART